MNIIKGGHSVGTAPTTRPAEQVLFYREEQRGRERRWEMKDDGRTTSAPIAEHLSLSPASLRMSVKKVSFAGSYWTWSEITDLEEAENIQGSLLNECSVPCDLLSY
jgi:hypothetical protein